MKINLTTGLAIIQTILLLIVVFQLNKLENLPAQRQVPTPTLAPEPQAPAPVIEASADDDPIKGDKKASVTIIEFSDFQCPFCAKFYKETLPQIEKNYIQTGKVRLVYRDYPLPFHPFAQKAAEAAECADEQGRFWEYHNQIFDNQAALGVENLKKWAADLKLDTQKFNDCLNSGKMTSEVQNDLQQGSRSGVSGTPSFFVNGRMIAGAQPYTTFQQAIDQALNG